MALLKPDVHHYNDPLKFLRDWFAYQKDLNPEFSLRAFSKSARLSVGFLPIILNGKRTLTERALERILPPMDLTLAEANFLRSLRKLAHSRDRGERRTGFQSLQKYQIYRRLNPKEFEVYRYLSRWFYVVIREMADMSHFQLDAEWIREHLTYPVPLTEIQKAIRFLVEHGFIEPASGGAQPAAKKDKHITCNDAVYRVAMAAYHQSMLKLVADSVETVERERRHIMGITVGMDEATFTEVKALIESTVARIRELTEKVTPRQAVYYVTLAAVPMAEQIQDPEKAS
ncbi:MAG: TIGR02147 family protein [Bacteriovoracia bacterium]